MVRLRSNHPLFIAALTLAAGACSSVTVGALQVSASASPPTPAAGDAVRFTCEATGAQPPARFTWEFGDGGTSAVATPGHTYAAAGTYVAVCTVVDAGGATGSAVVEVNVRATGEGGDPGAPPVVAVTPEAVSGAAPLLVAFTCDAQGGAPPFRYAWSFGDGITAAEPNPTYTYTRFGPFIATCAATDRIGRVGRATSEVNVLDPDRAPVIDAVELDNGWPGTDAACAAAGDTEVVLTAVAHDANDPPTGLRYLWTFDAVPFGSSATFTRTDVSTAAFTPDREGEYVARVWVTNERGKTVSRAATITAEGASQVKPIAPDPAPAGIAGTRYGPEIAMRVETACGVPVPGARVAWSSANATLRETDSSADALGVVRTQATLGCGIEAAARVTAVPLKRIRVEFVRPDGDDIADCIAPNVCIARGSRGPITVEGRGVVRWACGKCAGARATAFRTSFSELKDQCFNGNFHNIINKDTCLHVVEQDELWDIHWTAWARGDGNEGGSSGGFAYVREQQAIPAVGDGEAEPGELSVAVQAGPATALRVVPQRDVPVRNASGAKVAMDVEVSLSDGCGNRASGAEATFDIAVRRQVAFVHPDRSDAADCIQDDACINRGQSGGTYNSAESPTSLEWACGKCGTAGQTFYGGDTGLTNCLPGGSMRNIVGQDTCLRIGSTGALWDVHWTAWSRGNGNESGGGGGFAYIRTSSQAPPEVCFDDLCPEDGAGTPAKEGVSTTSGAVTLRVYARRAGWLGFTLSNLPDHLAKAVGWEVVGNEVLNLETNDGGFKRGVRGGDDPEWEWGIPTAGPAAAHSGRLAWATVLGSDYGPAAGVETRWLSRPFGLPCPAEGTPIHLTFWEHHAIADRAVAYVASGGARGELLQSADGKALYDTWLGGRRGWQSATSAWRKVRLNATAHRCERLDAFWTLLVDGATDTDFGWAIDDVAVEVLSQRPNASFIGAPAVDEGFIETLHGGVAACAGEPGAVRIAANDEDGNRAAFAPASLSTSGTGTIAFTGARPGTLVSATGGQATVNLGVPGESEVTLTSSAAGDVTVTLQAPAGAVASDVTFVAKTANEGGACKDGVDNDCDGKRDCADDECANVAACLCPQERFVFSAVAPASNQNQFDMGTIPHYPNARTHIVKLGICGDADQGSGPAWFRLSGGGLDFTWHAGQSNGNVSSTYPLSPTTWSMGDSNTRGFTYLDVDELGEVDADLTVRFLGQYDGDGHWCNDVDSEGNTFSDPGNSSARAWLLYEFVCD